MVKPLTLKLWRDLRALKGQLAAVAVVMACGVAMLIVMRSLILSLRTAEQAFYSECAFADVFCDLRRAPDSLRARLAQLDGVAAVETRVSTRATLDLPGVPEPADALVISLPTERAPRLHLLAMRGGRLPDALGRGEVVISEAFATANALRPGASLAATLHGRRRTLRVCGIALSPEFVFEARPGDALPDHRRFGVLWMNERELAAAADLDGAFNSVLIDTAPGTVLPPLVAAIDRLLAPYGGRSAYTRREHGSAERLQNELRVLGGLAVAFPAVFLSIAAFMASVVLSRLVRLQREQIAQLKALGYSSREVGAHYLGFAAVMTSFGCAGGMGGGTFLGSRIVGMYGPIFQFPALRFCFDEWAAATAVAASGVAAFAGAWGAVRMAVRLPPAEAMRPEPPARFEPSLLERLVPRSAAGPAVRMALRNLGRKPGAALLTAFGLALAAALPVVPGTIRSGIDGLLELAFHRAQRQDATLTFIEPASPSALSALQHLPGVRRVESFRAVPVRLSHGPASRRLELTGLAAGATLARQLDEHSEPLALPPEGLLISAKLAEVLGARRGDLLRLEVQEGERRTFELRLSGLITDYSGLAAFVEIGTLHRLLREGAVCSGAYLSVDSAAWPAFYRVVKNTPRIAALTLRDAARQSFRETTGEMIGKIQRLYFSFAAIIAFGVIYNSARVALSERGRELATLRVIGFTQRELAAVLIAELAVLTLVSLPLGLALGSVFAKAVIAAASSESVRLPFIAEARTYATAALIVTIASALSFAAVTRRLRKLDLLSALKARD